MAKKIDFSECRTILGKAYNGANGKKIGGFLLDDQADEAVIAPIYDCGSCLLPQADEKIMNDLLTDEDVLNARIYQFPTSAFIDDVPYITELQKAFYKRYIEARYEQILEPALEMALCDTQAPTQTM